MTPRRVDRVNIRSRLDDIPTWIIETMLDDFEPAALAALAAVENKRSKDKTPPARPQKPPEEPPDD
ncbi:hypothetical protein [Brevundimonas sp. NPDC058933]|uniref:hypothetical protein n=1 Tax=Brevundimonas sp. NPDC058933 TaxID=3346673 RepID=UPI003BEEBE37